MHLGSWECTQKATEALGFASYHLNASPVVGVIGVRKPADPYHFLCKIRRSVVLLYDWLISRAVIGQFLVRK